MQALVERVFKQERQERAYTDSYALELLMHALGVPCSNSTEERTCAKQQRAQEERQGQQEERQALVQRVRTEAQASVAPSSRKRGKRLFKE
jgi:hypothetical protein